MNACTRSVSCLYSGRMFHRNRVWFQHQGANGNFNSFNCLASFLAHWRHWCSYTKLWKQASLLHKAFISKWEYTKYLGFISPAILITYETVMIEISRKAIQKIAYNWIIVLVLCILSLMRLHCFMKPYLITAFSIVPLFFEIYT